MEQLELQNYVPIIPLKLLNLRIFDSSSGIR